MATTNKGRQLTEQHRKRQVGIVEAILRLLMGLWADTVDFSKINESTLEFARRAAPVVLRARQVSRETSREYLHDFRDAEVPEPLRQPIVDMPDGYTEEDALEELWVTARVELKLESRRGAPPGEALGRGRNAVAAKATKLVADGGRRAILDDVRHGKGPVGYARVVDADPCAFCAMLASRGVSYTGWAEEGAGLYRSDAFKASNSRFKGTGDFKVHDGCQCTLEPVYKVGGKIRLPGRGDQLARDWARVAAGQKDSFAAWRRWWDSGTLPGDYDGPLAEGEVKRPAPPKRGSTKRKSPKTAAERKGEQASRWENVSVEDAERFMKEAQDRLQGVEAELAEFEALGKTEGEIAVVSLRRQRQLLLSRIDGLRKHLGKM